MRIELERIGKSFGKVTALRDVQLAIPSGAKVALIGPNGSGKTTLIRVLLGLVGHQGRVVLDGGRRRAELASRIAYVPQVAPQMAAPVGDLVRAVCELRGLDRALVNAAAERLDLPLAALERREFRALSGGSKQKLLIALALAPRPALAILDEPTASLDAEARGRFLALQRELIGDATLILCSHRLDEIRPLVDHVIALDEGTVAYDGPAAEYLAGRVGTLLELRYRGSDPSWLVARGFAAGVDGWWSKSVDRDAKLALVPAALAALGPELADLSVRDVDLVELGGAA
ncbi:MAG TPA: ABC transporter ATP-binding protein [Kofleriaceae bacterium]|nr:ABC transporter ATP-binding protein [Kofleriaceae bacterium]